LFFAGCARPIDAIEPSNSVLDFGLNTLALTLQVWNNNPESTPIRIRVRASESWIRTDVENVES